MGYTCDFCVEQRAMVYCRSDAACLCLSCDRKVHSANALSKRHSRTLLCERCNSQPAFVRCAEEKISLCQNCDWMGHGTSTSASTHKRQTINCYSGCPSAAELSSIWSFVLDPSAVESTCEQEMGLMSITENGAGSTRDPPENANRQNPSGVVEPNTIRQIAKPGVWAGSSTSASTHKRQTINCYSGCPSAAELSSIWSFVLDPSAVESTCEQEMGLMSITENGAGSTRDPPENANRQNPSGVVEPNTIRQIAKPGVWAGSSTMPEPNPVANSPRQLSGSANAALPKLYCPGTGNKCPPLCEDDLYEDFNMDEIDLNLEHYEELFGNALNNSEELFQNGGIDSLFGKKNMSAADSNCQAAAEGSSAGLAKAIQPACSNAASADSMMSAKTDSILCFTARHGNSSLSFSGITGESSAGDYQDCGASPMLLMGEPPWCPPCPENSFTSANRNDAVLRYKEKKKTRKFEKRVRYASRKARADIRKRVKGRFVKAGDVYDYDPLTPTRSY